MKKYYVVSGEHEYYVLADDVIWNGNGLRFMKQNEIVAVFFKYDLWIIMGDEFEDKSN